ncbi:MAG: bis(5'-nucleosyl)-tetraphosphatase (symmetrical) YqeK [Endomicrobiales bacterium]
MSGTIDRILAYLKKHLPQGRLRHVRGACRMAVTLAGRHDVDRDRALLAGLLHDAAKGMPPARMIAYVRKRGLRVPDREKIIRFNPSLLHSFISADIARRVFHITDAAVLDAIARHTLGGAPLSALAKVIYIADAASPERRYPGVKELRAAALQDLDAAMRKAVAEKIAYVLKKRQWLHPETVKAWNFLILSKKDNAPTKN